MAGEVLYKFWWPEDITYDARDIAVPAVERAARAFPQLALTDEDRPADAVIAVTQRQAGSEYDVIVGANFPLVKDLLILTIVLDSETAEYRDHDVEALIGGHELPMVKSTLRTSLSGFFEQLLSSKGYGRGNRWLGTAERLLEEVDKLLQQKDLLLAKLERAYGDLDVANTRLTQLQAAYEQLRSERYESKKWTTPSMLVAIATLLVTLMSVLPIGASDDSNDDGVNQRIEAITAISEQLIAECGDTNVTINLPPAPLPETG